MPKISVSSTHISVLGGRINIDIQDVLRNLYFRADDIVLIAGSMIDGFGSSTSDLDIYVISEQRPKIEDFPAHEHHRHVSERGALLSVTDYMASTGMIVDAQYRTIEQVRALQTSVQGAYAQALQRTKILKNTMSLLDQQTVYRLYSAIPVSGTVEFQKLLQGGLSRDQFCYVLFRNVAGDYPLFNDVVGAWRDGDLLMGCERARLFLSKIAQGLTHLLGNTNAETKWLMKALECLPDQYQPLVSRYREVVSKGLSGTSEMRQMILDCINLSDDFFAAGRDLLNSNSCFMSIGNCERVTREEIDSYKSWHRDLTKEFAIRCRLFRSGLPDLVEFLPHLESERLSSFLDRSDLQPSKDQRVPVHS